MLHKFQNLKHEWAPHTVKRNILIHAWKHSYTILQLPPPPFPFVVTMPPTDSSNTHPALASAFKSVHLRRCTSWQTDSRGRYLRRCIECIFGSSLPVTVETPSILQRWGSTQLPTPTRLNCFMLPQRGRSWDGGRQVKKRSAMLQGNFVASKVDLRWSWAWMGRASALDAR